MTREEKIEILENEKAYMLSHGGDRQAIALDAAIQALQPKMGQWLSCAEEYGKPVKWVCSSCRHTKSITKIKTEFCPVCGARMGMTDKEIVDKLTELTTGSIDQLDLNDAMDLLCEIKRILSRRDRSE